MFIKIDTFITPIDLFLYSSNICHVATCARYHKSEVFLLCNLLYWNLTFKYLYKISLPCHFIVCMTNFPVVNNQLTVNIISGCFAINIDLHFVCPKLNPFSAVLTLINAFICLALNPTSVTQIISSTNPSMLPSKLSL